MVERKAPWRKTPLDSWSTDTDPSVMSGDEWVGPDDPGFARGVTEDDIEDPVQQTMLARFMHPQHDVTMDRDNT